LPESSENSGGLHPSVWKITAVAVIGSFLVNLDATVVNVSLSSLAAELHSTLNIIQWVTSGYLLAVALTLPLNGWLVDRIGAKTLYLFCFSVFTLSSVLCGLAWSANSLIAFRVLQGMTGGLLAPMAQMMMARAAGKQMARVMGYAALPIMLGPILGPVLAGAILQHASWHWLFFINVPVGVVAIYLAWTFLPNDQEETRRRDLDLLGLALLSPGLALVLYGLDHVRERLSIGILALAIILLVSFVLLAVRKDSQALVDMRLFRSKVFSVAAGTQFLGNGVMFAGQMLVPFYLIRACHFSPAATGWMLAPLGLGMLCSFPLMGLLTGKFGIRAVAAGGAFLALMGTVPLVYMSEYGMISALLAAALFIRGAGLGAIGIPSVTAAYASVKRRDLPMATTSLNIVQRLGGPTLTTLCATFLAWELKAVSIDAVNAYAFTATFLLLSLVQALLCIVAFLLPASLETPTEAEREEDSATSVELMSE
jgi:EmrB/QacA subfamily drug resistance transporter